MAVVIHCMNRKWLANSLMILAMDEEFAYVRWSRSTWRSARHVVTHARRHWWAGIRHRSVQVKGQKVHTTTPLTLPPSIPPDPILNYTANPPFTWMWSSYVWIPWRRFNEGWRGGGGGVDFPWTTFLSLPMEMGACIILFVFSAYTAVTPSRKAVPGGSHVWWCSRNWNEAWLSHGNYVVYVMLTGRHVHLVR